MEYIDPETGEVLTGREKANRNLVQYNRDKYDKEWVHATCKKAAQANAEKGRRYRAQREVLKQILLLDCEDELIKDYLTAVGIDPSYSSAINVAAVRKAARGDIEAIRYIRDTMGEKPTDVSQIQMSSAPVRALDLTKLSDAELEALADKALDGDDTLLLKEDN